MCGIFGYIGRAPDSLENLVNKVSRLLQHRGPDDYGFESGDGWGAGFRRLSILDLSELGHQPMSTPDGRFRLIFNGEIYNYVELKADLERQGEKFRSTSDTEVLLRLLAIHGPRALQQLNGMFALALIDTKNRTFLLARDRLGKKPLYYYLKKDQLRFASELKGLLAWPDAPRDVNPLAISQYLAFEYLPHSTCIFNGYHKLPQGHYIVGSFDKPEEIEARAYWQLDINGEERPGELSTNQLEELYDLLSDSTRIRLRSDVPIGFFLSGGIDSGLVAAIAARSPGGGDLRALTVSFDEKEYDETLLAKKTAEHIGMQQSLISQQSSGLADVDQIAWFFDEPFGDPSAIPTFNLCKVASEYGTVFLAGDGGDEAFGGYRKYFRDLKYRVTHSFPSSIGVAIEAASKLLSPLSPLRYRLARKSLPDGGFPAAFNRRPIDPVFQLLLPQNFQQYGGLAGQPFWDKWRQHPELSVIARWQKLDYDLYLPDDVLVKVDRASMAHSIEVRSPLLDYRIVEWAARLPRSVLLNTKEGKLPLRKLASDLLPSDVQAGGKRGFGTPLGAWFSGSPGQAFARERLLSDRARQRGLWNHEIVEKLIDTHQIDKGRDFGDWLWRLLVLDAWARHYLDGTDFLHGPPAKAMV
jgi:asparagine synthase (glutamine-hydrolysing)